MTEREQVISEFRAFYRRALPAQDQLLQPLVEAVSEANGG
jgi:hypothetical protein